MYYAKKDNYGFSFKEGTPIRFKIFYFENLVDFIIYYLLFIIFIKDYYILSIILKDVEFY